MSKKWTYVNTVALDARISFAIFKKKGSSIQDAK